MFTAQECVVRGAGGCYQSGLILRRDNVDAAHSYVVTGALRLSDSYRSTRVCSSPIYASTVRVCYSPTRQFLALSTVRGWGEAHLGYSMSGFTIFSGLTATKPFNLL